MVVYITVTAKEWSNKYYDALVSEEKFINTLATIIENHNYSYENIEDVHIVLPSCLTTEERHTILLYNISDNIVVETLINKRNQCEMHMYLSKEYVKELLDNNSCNSENYAVSQVITASNIPDSEDKFNYKWFICGVITGFVCGIFVNETVYNKLNTKYNCNS